MNPTEPLNPVSTSVSAGSPVAFQVLALSILTVLMLLTVSAGVFKKATKYETAFWCLVWLTGATAIIRYDFTMILARKLGIGRGADLLLYCAVGVMMVGFMMVYIRLRRIRREITLIVRHLALKEAPDGLGPGEQES